jgi:hypothetical protein
MILGLFPLVTFQTGRAKTEPLSTRNEQSFRVIRGQKGTGNHLDEESPGDLRYSNCRISIQSFKLFSPIKNNLSANGCAKHSPAL